MKRPNVSPSSLMLVVLLGTALILSACGPETLVVGLEPTPTPTPPPTPVLHTYANDVFGFAFQYPETWTLVEDPHLVTLRRGNLTLSIAHGWAANPGFRSMGGRTGMPAGDFIYGDKVFFFDQVIPAQVLEYERKDKMVLYGGTGLVVVDDLVFSIWLEDRETAYADLDIRKERQAEAKEILESFERTASAGQPPAATATPIESAASDPAAGLIYSTAETLWGIDVDGSPVALIDEPTARVSPDGARAVFATGLTDVRASDIWLVDLRTGTRRNVTNTPDREEVNPLWWPGRSDVIGFGSAEDIEIPDEGYPTVIRVDGTGYEVLDDEEGGPVGLSPDGALAAYGGYDHLGRIYRWGGEPEPFDPNAHGISVDKLYVPAWHPDGRHLAWEVGGDLTGEGLWQIGIVVFDLQAGTSQLLHAYEPKGGSFPHYLAWSPDGEWLAFVTYQEPPSSGRLPNLWVVRPQDQNEVYVGGGVDPVWSPDGQLLAFTEVRKEGNTLAIAGADGWQVQQVDLPHRIRSVSAWIAPRRLVQTGGDGRSTTDPDGQPTSLLDTTIYENPQYGFSFEVPADWEVEEIEGETIEDDVRLADSVVVQQGKFAIVVQYQRKSDPAQVAWGGSFLPGGLGYAEATLGERVTLLGEETYKNVWADAAGVKAIEVNTTGKNADLILSITLADYTVTLIQDDAAATLPEAAVAALDQIISSFALTG